MSPYHPTHEPFLVPDESRGLFHRFFAKRPMMNIVVSFFELCQTGYVNTSPPNLDKLESLTAFRALPCASKIVAQFSGVCLHIHVHHPVLLKKIRSYFAEYLVFEEQVADLTFNLYTSNSHQSEWEHQDAEFYSFDQNCVQRDFVAFEEKNEIHALLSNEWDDAVHNLFRAYLPTALLKQNAFLLHGAGIIYKDKGYVFFGQSGAGKSTVTSLCLQALPDAIALGDDAVIIQRKDEQTFLCPAPLGCGYSRSAPVNRSVEVSGIFSLQQSRIDKVEAMVPSTAIRKLLCSAMCLSTVHGVRDRLDLATQFVTGNPPLRELYFRKHPQFIESLFNKE